MIDLQQVLNMIRTIAGVESDLSQDNHNWLAGLTSGEPFHSGELTITDNRVRLKDRHPMGIGLRLRGFQPFSIFRTRPASPIALTAFLGVVHRSGAA